MDIEQFTLEVKAVEWDRYIGPLYYNPDDVSISLISLALADQESKERIIQIEGIEADLLLNAKITSDVMFAIGNDHSGTYYPAVRAALPFIIQVALYGNHVVARNCAINILIDLYAFTPDDGSNELLKFVQATIEKVIIENRESFTKFADDDKRNQSYSKEGQESCRLWKD